MARSFRNTTKWEILKKKMCYFLSGSFYYTKPTSIGKGLMVVVVFKFETNPLNKRIDTRN